MAGSVQSDRESAACGSVCVIGENVSEAVTWYVPISASLVSVGGSECRLAKESRACLSSITLLPLQVV